MKSLLEMFPKASQSFLEVNKGGDASCMESQKTAPLSDAAPTFKPKARQMNKTEAEFALLLETQKRNGEILRYEYEGIPLNWAGLRYTPDFTVFWRNISELGE